MTIGEAHAFFTELRLTEYEAGIGRQILSEILKRLTYLENVGLEYLTGDRLAGTLSGGEAQRISLATSLGSSLVGSLYILDEPSIGLHARDNERLINILKNLRNIGNTVVVVEHDREIMQQSDEIIDLGPRAGVQGGRLIFQGGYGAIVADRKSLTGQYLGGWKSIPLPASRRSGNGKYIRVAGASEHNLKSIDVEIPLNRLVCITGVSGSGKSTLVHDVLYAGLMRKKGSWAGKVGKHRSLQGDQFVGTVELVDQQPIGRTPRSNPATYVKVFDLIRDLFASLPASRLRGYQSGTFSFNVPGGRCDVCEGAGQILVEMQFLADVFLECEECKGSRYKKEILDIRYHDKNIHDVLNLTIAEGIEFFKAVPRIVKKFEILDEVGLGYLKIGQAATTLSGGEAQRIKLAAHLGEHDAGPALYILDEPTTGLHFDDIHKLLLAFDRLIEAGHSVLIIEHNLDVIKCADHLIDLGPEGGERGGEVVCCGTPEEVMNDDRSHTGRYLRRFLESRI
jgi:excinuclease ABC subunit A